MRSKFNALGNLSKIFVIVSVLLVSIFVFSYLSNVAEGLTMDKSSYNCTSDSMMMQLCNDPYVTSLAWAFLYTAIFGSPVLVAWLLVGIALLLKRFLASRKSLKVIEQ